MVAVDEQHNGRNGGGVAASPLADVRVELEDEYRLNIGHLQVELD